MKKITLILSLFLYLIHPSYSQTNEAIDYSKLIDLPSSELLEKGQEYEANHDLDTALMYYHILTGRYNQGMDIKLQKICMQAYNRTGMIYFEKGNYSKAFELFLFAIQVCEQNNMPELLPELYKNAGNTYCIFQDFEQGIESYKKGLQLAKEQNNTTIEVKILNNITGVYCFVNNPQEARFYYNEMLKHANANEFQPYLILFDEGLIFVAEGKYDKALECFKESANYASEHKLGPKYFNSSYSELADLYIKMEQYDSALYYIQKSIDVVKDNGPMYLYSESLKTLSNIYKKKGDNEKHLQYKSQYLTLYDSIFSQDEFNKMKNTQFLYEMDKHSRTIEMLNADKEKKEQQVKAQNRIILIVIICLLVFAMFFIILYFQKKQLHEAYRDLFNRNKELLEFEKQYKQLRTFLTHPANDTANDLLETEQDETYNDKNKLQSVDKLTDEQKEKLINDINKVMEDPEKFCDCDFSLDQLASLIGSNSRYVSQVINETYNKNFRAFINEYRIKEAQLRLINVKEYGNYTIKAIAESVGYKSPTSFVFVFKKTTGMSPSLYQSMTKKGI